ncbi:hypothetical protein JXQ70_15535 [bacterium]|nr:hypothetical protein [bacterium]
MRHVGLLFRARLRMIWHTLEAFNVEMALKLSLILSLGLVFIVFDFFFFWRILSQVMSMTELGVLRFSFLVRLLNMVFILFLGMVLFSNIVTALSTFFISRDLGLLLACPIRFSSIFWFKFTETYLNSTWTVLLFGLPIFIAYGLVLGAKLDFYLLLLPILVPFLLIPTSLGVSITVLLMRFFPAERTRQVIASLGVFVGAGIVVLVRLLKPEEFIRPISPDRLDYYDTLLRIPSSAYLPSTWSAESLMGLIERNIPVFQQYFALLWLTAMALVYFCFLMTRALYRQAYSRSIQGGTARPSPVRKQRRFRWEPLFAPLKPQMMAFFIKDIKLFFRETTQWSQMFLLGAIIFVYLFNIRSVPMSSWFMANFAGFLNVAMAGFVISALSVRFVFPAISLEGQAFWIVHSAPLNYRSFIIQKCLLYLVPLLLLSECVIVISNYFLKVDDFMKMLSMMLIFMITLANVGLGIGLGSLSPRFRVENPAQIALGLGGIVYMLLSLIYLLVVVSLEAWPVYMHFQNLVQGTALTLGTHLPYHLAVIVLSLIMLIIPPYLGARSLRRREL